MIRPAMVSGKTLTVSAWLEKAKALLDSLEVPEAQASIEFLMAAVLKTGRGQIHLHRNRLLTLLQGRSFWHQVKQRSRRMPLAYILGNQDFMGLEIEVHEDVLIPRPETEEVVEFAAELLTDEISRRAKGQKDTIHVLEIGTGTGCISIALGQLFPEAIIFATEISPVAMKLANKNAMAHHARNLRFINDDLFKPAGTRLGWADMVISNPPYIPTKKLDSLAPEVQCEPTLALDGGPDGLRALDAIIKESAGWLKPGGFIVLEIGAGQGRSVRKLLVMAGFESAAVRKDLSGHERIATARWTGE